MKTAAGKITMVALMSAVLCLMGPLSIPIGPVPISLTNLALYLVLYILGWKMGTLAYLVYLLIGLVGVPVFSGFSGGPMKLFGPTGGYLIGFLPMAVLLGLFLEKHFRRRLLCILLLEAATWIPYLMGTVWLSMSTGMSFFAALTVGVLIFLPVDLIKMVLAALIGPILRTRLAPFTGIDRTTDIWEKAKVKSEL